MCYAHCSGCSRNEIAIFIRLLLRFRWWTKERENPQEKKGQHRSKNNNDMMPSRCTQIASQAKLLEKLLTHTVD